MSVNAWDCPHCFEVIDYRPPSGTGIRALVDAVKDACADVRRHLEVCPAVRMVADAERYANGEQCAFTRSTTTGVVFRCQRRSCDGFHNVKREVAS